MKKHGLLIALAIYALNYPDIVYAQESGGSCTGGSVPVSVLGDPTVYCILGRPCSGEYSPESVVKNGLGLCPAHSRCALLPEEPSLMGCVYTSRTDVSVVLSNGSVAEPDSQNSSLLTTILSDHPEGDEENLTGQNRQGKSNAGSGSGNNEAVKAKNDTSPSSSFDVSSQHSGLDDRGIPDSGNKSDSVMSSSYAIFIFIGLGALVIVAIVAGLLLLRKKSIKRRNSKGTEENSINNSA